VNAVEKLGHLLGLPTQIIGVAFFAWAYSVSGDNRCLFWLAWCMAFGVYSTTRCGLIPKGKALVRRLLVKDA
jgi:hypothetical protein